ncbi:MAG: hypothetical protein CL912_01460 [Deltaproteobacteria bacterium]|nr:hypothetical protein [Deltaproteobacteria bacterium]
MRGRACALTASWSLLIWLVLKGYLTLTRLGEVGRMKCAWIWFPAQEADSPPQLSGCLCEAALTPLDRNHG